MKKILITGATGLVGSEIMRICSLRNIKVNYLTTRKDKIENSDSVRGYLWNPSKYEIDKSCLHGVDAIINLAGVSVAKKWTPKYKKTILKSRIDSLQTLKLLLEDQKDHTVKSLVSASAIGFYPSSLTNYYSEEDSKGDSFLAEVVTKWEASADEFKELGLEVTKIRIGIVLSEKGGALPQIAKPIKFYAGAPLGSGEQWQSWIHITDLAEMFLFVLNKNVSGIYNAVAPNPVTNTKLTREVASALKKPIVLPNIPEWTLKLILGEMADILFESQRVSCKKIESLGFNFTHTNISGALSDILADNTELASTNEFVSR